MLSGTLTVIDEDVSESQTVSLDAADLSTIIESLHANGYPRLASRIHHAIDPEVPEDGS